MRVLIRPFGLGDGIVLAGAAVILSKDEPLIFPCQIQDEESFRKIFENDPNILVKPAPGVPEMLQLGLIAGEPIFIGEFKEWPAPTGLGFDQWLYNQLGIPIEEKWNSFPLKFDHIPRDPGVKFFLHDDATRGYSIDLDRIVGFDPAETCRDYPPVHIPRGSITEWAGPMIRAGELHFINSGPLHFADQLPLKPEQPKFLHRYARPWSVLDMPKLRHNWQMLD
jgi:hypothetical protein